MLSLGRIEPPWDQRVARFLVKPLRGTPVTPNVITTLSLVVGLIAAGLFAQGGDATDLGATLFMVAFLLDHADGELARTTGQTSSFGHYYDVAAGGAVLIALFIGIGVGERQGALGTWSIGLGVGAGLATAVIFGLRMELERRAGKASTVQPNLLGFELEDLMYLVGPITWLGGLEGFLVLAGSGTPLFALRVLWDGRRMFARAGQLP